MAKQINAHLNGKFNFSKMDYGIILGLLLLSVVPIIAGIFKVYQLNKGIPTNDTLRFGANPIPFVIHIVVVTIYSVLGAFQFAPGFRKKYLNLHRQNGKILVVAAVLVAITGLWMTFIYPFATLDGNAVYLARLVVGAAMLIFIFFGVVAIFKTNYADHGHWMIRAYALALGAGTQVFTHLPWIFFPELKNEFTRAVFMILGWIINITVAECIIQNQQTKRKIDVTY